MGSGTYVREHLRDIGDGIIKVVAAPGRCKYVSPSYPSLVPDTVIVVIDSKPSLSRTYVFPPPPFLFHALTKPHRRKQTNLSGENQYSH